MRRVRRCHFGDDQPIITFRASFPALVARSAAEKAVNRLIEQDVLSTWDLGEECSQRVPSSKSIQWNEVAEDCRVSRVAAADLLSMRCHYWADWRGNPHPFGTIWYLNYDLRTGRELTVDDVFVDVNRLKSLLREDVRQSWKEETSGLDDEDMENLIESLVRSFGFKPDGVDFSALQGRLDIGTTLSYEALGGVLKPRFFPN